MKNGTPKINLTIRLEKITWQALHARAEKDKRSLSQMVDLILSEYFQDHPLRNVPKGLTRKKRKPEPEEPEEGKNEPNEELERNIRIAKTRWIPEDN